MGTSESSRTLESSEFYCKAQNTLHWGVICIIGKLLKCRCPKCARMTHLNWQFDSRPRKVENQLDSLACRWCATCRWKALDEGYNFGWDLVPIGGLHQKLWSRKVAELPSLAISGLPLGSLGTKSHLDATPVEWCRVYYMGEGGGFPRVRAVVKLMNPEFPWFVLAPKVFQKVN
jgi:hypothetical protein